MTGSGDHFEGRSGFANFGSGDTGTAKDVLTVRPEATLQVNDILVTYADGGTGTATVELYDDDEGTTAGNLSNQFDEIDVVNGDAVVLNDIVRDEIENDIVAVPRSNDADVKVSIGAKLVTG